MVELTKIHLQEIIRTANGEFVTRFSEAQFQALAKLYTPSGIVLPPNIEMVKGQEAIAEFWQAVHSMGIKYVKLESVEVESCGGLAVEVGLFELFSADRQMVDQGKYIVIWKHEEGEWKLHRDIFNSSLTLKN